MLPLLSQPQVTLVFLLELKVPHPTLPLATGFVGGGYHTDLDVLADRHIHLHRAAQQMWEDHGLG